jgi:hypothetical protein
MALTSGLIGIRRRGPPSGNGTDFGYPVSAGEQIWLGSLLALTSGNTVQRIQTSGSAAFAGISPCDFSNVGNGTASVRNIEPSKGTWCLAVPGATGANVGMPVYAIDDNTLTLTNTGGLLQIGTLAGIDLSELARIGPQTFVRLLGS